MYFRLGLTKCPYHNSVQDSSCHKVLEREFHFFQDNLIKQRLSLFSSIQNKSQVEKGRS